MWNTIFVGPVLAAQRLAGPGEGEQSCVRGLLPQVRREVLGPVGVAWRARVLANSLQGDGADTGRSARRCLARHGPAAGNGPPPPATSVKDRGVCRNAIF